MSQCRWHLFQLLSRLCILVVIVFLNIRPAISAEILANPGSYDISLSLEKSAHGYSETQRIAQDLAHARLVDWLILENVDWPTSIGYHDRSFLLQIYKSRRDAYAIIKKTELLDSNLTDNLVSFDFRVQKKNIKVTLPSWLDVKHAVIHAGKQIDGIDPLMQLEMADRFPNLVSHKFVARRLRQEIGENFLRFLIGYNVGTIGPSEEVRITSSAKILDLAKALSLRPYDINLAFLMVSRLRGKIFKKVSCRIARQGLRGSKIAPSYGVLREYANDNCSEVATWFRDGVTESQIAEMNNQLNLLDWPQSGAFRLVVESFGEFPLEKKDVDMNLKCEGFSNRECIEIFNQNPGISIARSLGELLAKEGYKMVASSLMHQASVWEKTDKPFSGAFTKQFPESEQPIE